MGSINVGIIFACNTFSWSKVFDSAVVNHWDSTLLSWLPLGRYKLQKQKFEKNGQQMKFQVPNMGVLNLVNKWNSKSLTWAFWIWSTNEIPSPLHERLESGQQMKFLVPNMSVSNLVNKWNSKSLTWAFRIETLLLGTWKFICWPFFSKFYFWKLSKDSDTGNRCTDKPKVWSVKKKKWVIKKNLTLIKNERNNFV